MVQVVSWCIWKTRKSSFCGGILAKRRGNTLKPYRSPKQVAIVRKKQPWWLLLYSNVPFIATCFYLTLFSASSSRKPISHTSSFITSSHLCFWRKAPYLLLDYFCLRVLSISDFKHLNLSHPSKMPLSNLANSHHKPKLQTCLYCFHFPFPHPPRLYRPLHLCLTFPVFSHNFSPWISLVPLASLFSLHSHIYFLSCHVWLPLSNNHLFSFSLNHLTEYNPFLNSSFSPSIITVCTPPTNLLS